MDLFVQLQCLVYSFFFGFIMCGLYHVVNRFLYGLWKVLRYVVQVLIGFVFGFLYHYGLVRLNEGILRGYFFILMFMGYMFYQRYYAYYFLYMIEKWVKMFKRIIRPFIFFFSFINGIMKKSMKRVRKRWRKKER